MPRIKGHYEGMQTVKKITKYASQLGVKYLTLYAFSTENWARPKEEVSYLMDLPEKMFNSFMPELMENNVKVEVIGFVERLPENTRKAVSDAIEQTKNNTGLKLIFALNYGSKDEILKAVKQIAKEKTVILISHRLANVTDSDAIYMLKDGKIIEKGTHHELMGIKGTYANLFSEQSELENYSRGREEA